MNNGQIIPRISPVMLRDQPDQTCEILNRIIDRVGNYRLDIMNINNEIINIKKRLDALENQPEPSDVDWIQTRLFDPNNMGSTPHMCLQNCREGFGIPTGHFPTARADWESQIANGTLHEGYPPSYVQVPVYIDTGVPAGHVVVWDRGTVWSDGAVIPQGLAYYSNIIGWGELIDNNRVVQRI